ncbi:alpha/beta fold hydrolase [Pigmentiphaga soli]|uniref:Alpha/beta fold hydrolase n=1 Tax=Pigmentiphaga soli TaxID=1007095 RepID=A0ABP8HM20_9BURK
MTLESSPADGFAARIDLGTRALLARLTASMSPQALALAWLDWASHLAVSPGKGLQVGLQAACQAAQLVGYRWAALAAPTQAVPPVTDRRFADPAWRQWPFNLLHQSFLLHERLWDGATHGVRGVEPHHEQLVAFFARQWLDMLSPGNFGPTNPVVLRRTMEEAGNNLWRGHLNLVEDARRLLAGEPPAGAENFVPGREVAVTPGKVVLRNRVMELIQYAPAAAGAQVHPEPLLVVPAWIMKYYILDLSPHNSLIRYLVAQGRTVFCISWKNPGEAERDLGMDDYLEEGFHAALDAVNAIVPQQPVHAVGYCLGGTLLAIAAAAMARDGDHRLATMTLFAAQTDFAEPGELGLFIDESEVSLLEAQMARTGYLTAGQMAGAFQMLRSYDLLWSRLVGDYLLGERPAMNDLMAWNADATRMPAKMHGQYLRRLFLHDDLAQGRYPVRGRPVALADLTLPVFMVGTETDHVAPWRSVFKLQYQTLAEITFVLTSGGHNAGIVSEPGHPRRHYRLLTHPAGAPYVAPEEWLGLAPVAEGSWWPEWVQWLRQRSADPGAPPRMGAPRRGYPVLGDAPGRYVLEK